MSTSNHGRHADAAPYEEQTKRFHEEGDYDEVGSPASFHHAKASPRGAVEVPIIITSAAPDRERSYHSMGGGSSDSYHTHGGHHNHNHHHGDLYSYSTDHAQPHSYPGDLHSTFMQASSPYGVGTYPSSPSSSSSSAQHDMQYYLQHYHPHGHYLPAEHAHNHNNYHYYHHDGHTPGNERVSPEESTGKAMPLTGHAAKAVAGELADALLNSRPSSENEESNKKDDPSQGAVALAPGANGTQAPSEHKRGHLHIPSFLRGRRSRRNSLSSENDTMSSGSLSGDDLSDVEFDEELDEKLREEVEKDLPRSITDLTKAERTNVRKVYLLYNPMSGNKRGRSVAKKAVRMMEREGVVVEMVRLTERGHAEQLCESLDFDGYDVVVGVGGDGTFHECINGMMRRSVDQQKKAVPLALIAAGTGNSFMHELRCYKLKAAIYHILRGVNYPIDICRLTFGDGSSCYSFNSIHWGIASKIMLTAERLRWMGHAMRYTTACFMEIIAGDHAQMAKIMVTDENDKEVEYNDRFIVAIANNIITASKGMKMAPQAKLDDGLIDLLLIKATSTLNLLDVFRRTYDGSHTDLPYVIYQKVKKFTITPYKETDGEIEEIEEVLDVDGELKGCTPFTCEVMPQVLRIVL